MSNVKATFNAEPHHILEVDGKTYRGGDEISLDHERVAELVAQGIPLSYDRNALTRGDLEEIAKSSGVDPEDFKTKAELADALADATPQPPDHTPSITGVPTDPSAPADPATNESEED